LTEGKFISGAALKLILAVSISRNRLAVLDRHIPPAVQHSSSAFFRMADAERMLPV